MDHVRTFYTILRKLYNFVNLLFSGDEFQLLESDVRQVTAADKANYSKRALS